MGKSGFYCRYGKTENNSVLKEFLDDMRSLKSENTRYIKDIIEQYTEDYSIDEDHL